MNPHVKLLIAVLSLLLTLPLIIDVAYAQNQITLTIHVHTVDGNPLQNAYVEVDGEIKPTDSNGNASFTILDNETYTVYVYYPAGHKVAEKTNVKNVTSLAIEADVISSWSIYIYDGKERDPVPGANVTIVYKANESIRYSELSDSNGKVTFGPIPCEDNYKVYVDYGEISYSDIKDPEETAKITLPLYRVVLDVRDKKNSPVEGVEVKLREELDQEPIASAMSGSDGKAILKLIPNGKYYVEAWLKGVKVYESDGKEISVSNDDAIKTLIVDAVKLNITVLDYDGENIMKNYSMKGELIRNGEVIAEAESVDGILHFGHTPFETYQLKIMLGDLELYSGEYDVDLETAEGFVEAWFYDIILELNASRIVNASLARSLTGRLTAKNLLFEFETEEWKAKLEDVPRSEDYKVELFYKDKPIAVIEPIRVTEDDQIVKLNLTGYKILVTTLNLDGKPVSADLVIKLPEIGIITSFKSDEHGIGSSGELLPLTYVLEAFTDGFMVGRAIVDLREDTSLTMNLHLRDIYFRVFDRDGRDALDNVTIKLMHGSFEKLGERAENKTLIVRNLPMGEYRLIANYYGFKVFDKPIEISEETREVDIVAPGVLDVELLFLDSEKKPLDQGYTKLSFGGFEIGKNISKDGRTLFDNLPNVTIRVEAYYKGVKLELSPNEFDLTRDDMRLVIISSVHTLTARILRGDGKDLRIGKALLYVNGILEKSYDLSEDNELSERLPEAEIKIEIKYKGRDAGMLETYLEKSLRDLAVYSTIYPLKIYIRDPVGEPVKDAKLVVEDSIGVIAEASSGENGLIETLLPTGSYNAFIQVGNDIYSIGFKLEKSKTISFLYTGSQSGGFELVILMSAIDLAVSGYAISKIPRRRAARVRRRPRRVPRV